MKQRTRTSIPLPKSTLKGKPGVVLRPGEKLTLPINITDLSYPVRRLLRVVGETDIFWQWRIEGAYKMWLTTISDALDPEHAYGEKYSLCLQGQNEMWPRNAYMKLIGESFAPNQEMTFTVMVSGKGISLSEDGELGVELGIYLSKPNRDPADVIDVPDITYRLDLPEGTFTWQELSAIVSIPADATALLVRIGGKLFSGKGWIGSPRLFNESTDTIIPPLMPEHPHKGWERLNWLGENLCRMGWPEFEISVDDMRVLRRPMFNSSSRSTDFEITLPALTRGTHEIGITLTNDYHFALPFVVQHVDLIEESARPVEIIGYPEYVKANESFSVLIERNSPDGFRLEAVQVDAGPACPDPVYDIRVGEETVHIRPNRVVECDGNRILLSSGDAYNIPQEIEPTLRFMEWYIENHIGNCIPFRSIYHWCGTRVANPEMWKIVIHLLEKMQMPYVLMPDFSHLPAILSNPSDEVMAGHYYLGSQTHEIDGLFSYFCWPDYSNPIEKEVLARYKQKNGMHSVVRPLWREDGGLRFQDTEFAKDMKEAAEYFVRNVRLTRGTATRHTGPTTLFHYFYDAGYDWLGAETMYGSEEILLASIRGATRAAGKADFGTHAASQWSSAPHDSQAHADRYFLSLATYYMQGAAHINMEDGLWKVQSIPKSIDRFSCACEIHREAHRKFRRFLETHPRRGEMRVPLAVIQGRYCGWRCFARGQVWGSTRPDFAFGPSEESFDLLNVFYPRAVLDAIYVFPCSDDQPQGWYTGTPYGSVDLIPLTKVCEDVLATYKSVAFLGWNTFEESDFEKLLAYVNGGGTLLLAKPHLSTNVKRNQPSELPPDSTALKHLLGEDYRQIAEKTVRSVGNGKIVYFPSDVYPCDKSIKAEYEAELRSIGEYGVQSEAERGWISGTEDVSFTAFDWKNGTLRTLYVLNTDWWSGKRSSPAKLLFGRKVFDLEARAGIIEVITASTHYAVMPEQDDVDVLNIEETCEGATITVQSDAGACLRVFSWKGNAPQYAETHSGGVQKINITG